MLLEGFAVKSIGRRVLSRYGRSATPEQLADYDAAFPRYMVTIYQTRLIDYKDATLKVAKVEQVDANNQIVHAIVSGAPAGAGESRLGGAQDK
ncbi:ABC transporter substrate-binding protein [Hankyongella ginsenosidimutans]|uniref:ABC transporter substrate-binding protein n=1 Tax=Hankyongella ginsenosidimutans TaxID=1763828 RepID=A0A4D7C8J7_9SPHN|nr:ABC transporter substrate-binding protein [Hankyongella ginsenosidimutans]